METVPPGPLIGIDVGGTKIAAGLVDGATGAVRHERRLPSAGRDGSAVIADVLALAAALSDLAATEGRPATGIGIALPELVDREGRVHGAWNFDLTALPERLSAAFGRGAGGPVLAVDSDVRAAARAEACFGAGRDLPAFAYLTLSTGISYTFCRAGEPWAGANGFAIHLATTRLRLPGPAGGLIEAIPEHAASGKAMAERWAAVGGTGDGVPAIEAAATAGDDRARTILTEGAEIAGALVALLVDVLDPGALVIGGGLGLSAGLFMQRFETSVRRTIAATPLRSIPMIPARLGDRAGLVGAALAAMPPRDRRAP